MRLRHCLHVLTVILLLAGMMAPQIQGSQDKPAALDNPQNRDAQRLNTLKEEVRHELVMLPNYSVFDWLEAEVKLDGTVMLRGQVAEPITKSNAEARLKRLESVKSVVNELETLPLSPMDNELRMTTYRSIYSFNSPLFRYATQAVPPIHIIIKNGTITLKGVVDTQADSQLAYNAARQVTGAFSVKNELKVLAEESSRK